MMISDESQGKFKDMLDLMDVDSDSEAFETELNDDVLSYIDYDEVGSLFKEISTQDGYSDFDELDELTNYASDPSEFIPNISDPSNDKSEPYPFEAAYSSFDADDLVGSAKTKSAEVDLYNSSVTCHMSRFHHRFIDFTEIEPIPIIAAEK